MASVDLSARLHMDQGDRRNAGQSAVFELIHLISASGRYNCTNSVSFADHTHLSLLASIQYARKNGGSKIALVGREMLGTMKSQVRAPMEYLTSSFGLVILVRQGLCQCELSCCNVKAADCPSK